MKIFGWVLAVVFSAACCIAAPEDVLKTPGLVAFWDFQEDAGTARVSKGGQGVLSLMEMKGPILRADEGVFGKHSAQVKRGQWFRILRKDIGALDIHGKEASVSVVAWVKRKDRDVWQAVAGVWDETRKKRQYCLFLNAGTATRADEMKRYPVKDRAHGHVSAIGGPTPGNEFCISYSSAGNPVPYDEWVCIAMTYDGNFSKVYVNGKLDAWEQRNPFPYEDGLFDGGEDGADFTVGAVHRGGSWGNFFGGLIGGVAVFQKALGEEEILGLTKAAGIE